MQFARPGSLFCFGEPTNPDVSAIIPIRFSPSGNRFAAREAEPPGDCIGPLQRIRRNSEGKAEK